MDEVFKLVIENREKTVMRRLRGMSDDMVRKTGTELGKSSPTHPNMGCEKSLRIRKRNRRKLAGWRRMP